ncbi:LysE family translocator [Pseudomonas sp. PS1]|uniref:LysE family translocator n=1 Tax=Stutzerimonas marianensis TaxID=2929513 RepID=A0A9X1W1H2_9GAMM|nr:LysE family translocator [Pseudomonas marianensis]MCJ0973186.1 LysE family translocator [Pseudomonas marianensis]
MSNINYVLFVLIVVAQVGSPGPSTVFLIRNAVIYGPSRAVWILTGDLLAIAVLASCSMLGLDALLVSNPRVFMAIQAAGAGYLVWLGVQQLRLAGRRVLNEDALASSERLASLWRKSFVVGISNPKAILFFAALLPQFVDPEDTNTGALLSMILLFLLIKLMVSAAYALAAKKMSKSLARPGAAALGKRLTGAVLVMFGVAMGSSAFG